MINNPLASTLCVVRMVNCCFYLPPRCGQGGKRRTVCHTHSTWPLTKVFGAQLRNGWFLCLVLVYTLSFETNSEVKTFVFNIVLVLILFYRWYLISSDHNFCCGSSAGSAGSDMAEYITVKVVHCLKKLEIKLDVSLIGKGIRRRCIMSCDNFDSNDWN